jgi:hypothetical protein
MLSMGSRLRGNDKRISGHDVGLGGKPHNPPRAIPAFRAAAASCGGAASYKSNA